MAFNSYLFLLLFLPLCLMGYFLLNRWHRYTAAQVFLLGMSLWFYGYTNPSYLLIIAGSVTANYCFGLLLQNRQEATLRRLLLAAAIVLNVGALFYYKYCNFFLHTLNRLFQTDLVLQNILLPLGISFFTFQQIGYLVDVYRREAPRYSFLHYAGFVAFFPVVLSGPIVTHDELIPQFQEESRKTFSWPNFARGLFRFTLGLSKKVLIADVFGQVVNWGFGNPGALDTTNAMFVTLGYAIQIYFDFSGYSDMAVGLAKLLNLDLPENFDSPYHALTITGFWKRWHKTLTRFLTKYIYFPLGGSRRGRWITYRNILLVFLVSGLWHGANETFLIWGLLHGLAQVLTRHWMGFFDRLPRAVSWLMTFLFLNLTWILFRANSVEDACTILQALGSLNFGPLNDNVTGAFLLPELVFLMEHRTPMQIFYGNYAPLAVLAYGAAFLLIFHRKNARDHMESFRPRLGTLLGIYVLLVWCVLSFASVTSFLYFDF